MIAFFAAEAVFAGICLFVHISRGGTEQPAKEAHDMVVEEPKTPQEPQA